MKTLLTSFILIFICVSCSTQNDKNNTKFVKKENMYIPQINSNFEKIDVKQLITTGKRQTYSHSELREDGTYIHQLEGGGGYVFRETSSDSYFTIVKVYDKKGFIVKKGLVFTAGHAPEGTWYYFNDQGEVEKTIDFNRHHTFTFEDVLRVLEKEKAVVTKGPVLPGTGFHASIEKNLDENGDLYEEDFILNRNSKLTKEQKNAPLWRTVFVEEGKPMDKATVLIIDGETGEILERSSIPIGEE